MNPADLSSGIVIQFNSWRAVKATTKGAHREPGDKTTSDIPFRTIISTI